MQIASGAAFRTRLQISQSFQLYAQLQPAPVLTAILQDVSKGSTLAALLQAFFARDDLLQGFYATDCLW